MRMIRFRKSFLCIFITLFSALSGFSNYKELNEIGIVIGLGIDYLPKKELYEFTFQVINPSENVAKGAGTGSTPVVDFKSTGKTLSEAALNSTSIFSRRNIFSHIHLIVIGEQLAIKESLNFVFDVFERDAGVRVNVPVLIARDSGVKATMDTLSSIDKIPVRNLVGKLKNASLTSGEHGETKIYEVIEDLTNFGSEPYISGITVKGDQKTGTSKDNLEKMEKTFVVLDGVAVFRKGKLVGWIDGEKTKSLQIITNKLKTTNLKFHCDKKRYNNIIVNHLKNKSKVKLKNQQAIITVQVNAYGAITELLCNKDISKRETLKEYEKKAEQELKKEIMEGILAAQKLKSDVFGFGEIFRLSDPGRWKESKNRWNQVFSEAKIKVDVNVEIEGTGMRIKPYPY